MALKIRMSRAGAKKKPFYRLVVADSRMPRDGRYIERVGTYDPLLPKDAENRVVLKTERIQYWLSQGAKPSDRVAKFLGSAEIIPMPAQGNNPNKAKPKAKAQERAREAIEAKEAAKVAAAEEKEAAKVAAAEAKDAAKAAAAEAAAAPAEEEGPVEAEAAAEEEAPAEEAASDEEEAPKEAAEAPAEEAAAEEAPAEEAAEEEAPKEEEKT